MGDPFKAGVQRGYYCGYKARDAEIAKLTEACKVMSERIADMHEIIAGLLPLESED